MPVVIINGKEMHYQDKGNGPVIVLGHSFLWDSHMWQPQIDSLAKTYRVIAPDLWSHGQSAVLSERSAEYSVQQLADDFQELLDEIKVSECALIGLSVGGMWGTQLALQDPKRIKALVIMDSYVGVEPVSNKTSYFGLINNIKQANQFTDIIIEQVTPLFFSSKTLQTNPKLVTGFKESLKSIPQKNIPGIASLACGIFNRASLMNQLTSLKIPVMVVVGEDDIPRPPAEAKAMVDQIAQAQYVCIPNAGHICNKEQPSKVTDLLQNFLASNYV